MVGWAAGTQKGKGVSTKSVPRSGWRTCQSHSIRMSCICEQRALRRAQTGEGSPNPGRPLCEAWLLTCDSPGWLGPSLPWGRPSNQEIFRGLSTRPTSFWTASSCQTQPPVGPITPKTSYGVALSTPTESTRTSKLILQAKLSNLPMMVCRVGSWRRGKGRVGPQPGGAPAPVAEWRGGASSRKCCWSTLSFIPEHSPAHPFPRYACTPPGIPESGVKHLGGCGGERAWL